MSEAKLDLSVVLCRAVQNGFVFGYRVRFIHALAYQLAGLRTKPGLWLLLRDVLQRVWKSMKMGAHHGKTLALYAVVYKLVMAAWVASGSKADNWSEFVAGAVGGVVVYSGWAAQRSSGRTISEKASMARQSWVSGLFDWLSRTSRLSDPILVQITMYTMSRLVMAIGRDASYTLAGAVNARRIRNGTPSRLDPQTLRDAGWMATCALVWGGIMVYYARDAKRGETRKDYLQRALRVSMEFIYGNGKHQWGEMFYYGK